MFAGPADAAPKALVEELIQDTGFVPTYLGPIRYARNLEVSRTPVNYQVGWLVAIGVGLLPQSVTQWSGG